MDENDIRTISNRYRLSGPSPLLYYLIFFIFLYLNNYNNIIQSVEQGNSFMDMSFGEVYKHLCFYRSDLVTNL